MMSQVAQDGGRPWVSVVMSVYNGGRYLEAALRSARAQSVSDIEILVVDDRSSDDSLAIARRHAADDARIRVFALDANLGPAGARNVALAVARGAWVAVFDCDDLMHPQRLERLLLHAEATGADIVADDVMIFADHANTPNAALLGKQNPGSIGLAAFIRANLLFGRGVALGYLKPLKGGAGTWRARLYLPDTRAIKKVALGTADDVDAADGERILSYGQALKKASKWVEDTLGAIRKAAAGQVVTVGPYTVQEAWLDYLAAAVRGGAHNPSPRGRRGGANQPQAN